MTAPNFFKDDHGSLHGGRLAGAIYIFSAVQSLIFAYLHSSIPRAHLASQIAYTVGWWLAFGDKRTARSFVDLIAWPRHAIGAALVIIGLVGSFHWLS